MRRHQLALTPSHYADGSVRMDAAEITNVLAQRDPLLTWTYLSFIKAAVEGRQGPFTAADILRGIGSVSAKPPPTLQSVEDDLAKLYTLGIVTFQYLN